MHVKNHLWIIIYQINVRNASVKNELKQSAPHKLHHHSLRTNRDRSDEFYRILKSQLSIELLSGCHTVFFVFSILNLDNNLSSATFSSMYASRMPRHMRGPSPKDWKAARGRSEGSSHLRNVSVIFYGSRSLWHNSKLKKWKNMPVVYDNRIIKYIICNRWNVTSPVWTPPRLLPIFPCPCACSMCPLPPHRLPRSENRQSHKHECTHDAPPCNDGWYPTSMIKYQR